MMKEPRNAYAHEVFETEIDLLTYINGLKKEFIERNPLFFTQEDFNEKVKHFNRRTVQLDKILNDSILEGARTSDNKVDYYYNKKDIIRKAEVKRDEELAKIKDKMSEDYKKVAQRHENSIMNLINERKLFIALLDLKVKIEKTLVVNKDIPATVSVDTGKYNTKYTYHEFDSWGRMTFKNYISHSFLSRVSEFCNGMLPSPKDDILTVDGIEYIVGPTAEKIYKGINDVDSVTTKATKEHRILLLNALDKLTEITKRNKFNLILLYSVDQFRLDQGDGVALTVLNRMPSESEITERIKALQEEENEKAKKNNKIPVTKKRSDALSKFKEDLDYEYPIKESYEIDYEEKEVFIYDIITRPETLSGVLSTHINDLLTDKKRRDLLVKDIGGLNSSYVKINNDAIGNAKVYPDTDGMIDVSGKAARYIKSINSGTGLSNKTTINDIERILKTDIPEKYDELYEKIYIKNLVTVNNERYKELEKETSTENKNSDKKTQQSKLYTVEEIKDQKSLKDLERKFKSDELKEIRYKSDEEALLATFKYCNQESTFKNLVDFFIEDYIYNMACELNNPDLEFNKARTELVFIGGGSSELRVFIHYFFNHVYPEKFGEPLGKKIVLPKDTKENKLLYANVEGAHKGFFQTFSRNRKRINKKQKEKKESSSMA